MNKKFAILALAISLMGASCGSSPSSSSGIVSNFPKEKLTLTVWSPLDDQKAYEGVMNGYHASHPNVYFTYRHIDPAQYDKEVITGLASGNGPDIILLKNDQLASYKDKLIAMPNAFYSGSDPVTVTSSQYSPAVAKDLISGGKVYGVALYTDTLSIYLNTDLLNQAFNEKIASNIKLSSTDQQLLYRAPADWDEFLKSVKLITKRNGDTIERAAVAVGSTQNVSIMGDLITAMMMQQGLSMTSTDLKSAAFQLADTKDPTYYPGAAVLDYLKVFTDPKSQYYTWNSQMPSAVDAFVAGKTVMMFNYASVAPGMSLRNPSLHYTVAPLPQIPNSNNIVDYANYRFHAVTNNSKYSLVAWDFLRTLATTNYASLINEPSSQSNGLPSNTVQSRVSRNDPFTLQIPTARSWYKGVDPSQSDSMVIEMFNKVLTGTNSRQAVDQAATKFNTLLNSTTSG